jgi:hypothetical protein
MSTQQSSKADTLDALLDGSEPHATFKGAIITRIEIDYEKKRWVADLAMYIGDPDSLDPVEQERARSGQLIVDGLGIWAIEPPPARGYIEEVLELSEDGLLPTCPTDAGREVAQLVEPDEVGWWLYFGNLNAYAYLTGRRAEFRWRTSSRWTH